jgi:hypothetical protein
MQKSQSKFYIVTGTYQYHSKRLIHHYDLSQDVVHAFLYNSIIWKTGLVILISKVRNAGTHKRIFSIFVYHLCVLFFQQYGWCTHANSGFLKTLIRFYRIVILILDYDYTICYFEWQNGKQ